eukprot:CAMPEP_0119208614 /NCGR_PEP_ID=MMETSP1327-20130426/784_1 /TAXON_ID=38833 /ORGANISM="Micromonas pusilla, Strain RCC2306" /LENGTH=73 /DNA_ID=CAMNT_0007205185 /DNA_START=12 /DNA_END=233 /DNA_ORIENTATION=-
MGSTRCGEYAAVVTRKGSVLSREYGCTVRGIGYSNRAEQCTCAVCTCCQYASKCYGRTGNATYITSSALKEGL